MKLEEQVKQLVVEVVQELYAQSIDENIVKIDKTPSEFQGELTVVIFPFVKISRKNPEITAKEIGEALQNRSEIIESFNVVKGFLNISFTETYWLSVLKQISNTTNFGEKLHQEKNMYWNIADLIQINHFI